MEDSATLSLPDDPEVLKAIIADLQRQRIEASRKCKEASRQREKLQRQCDAKEIERLRLEVELLRLRKLYYGAKADELTHYTDTVQLVLEFGQQLEALPPSPRPRFRTSTPSPMTVSPVGGWTCVRSICPVSARSAGAREGGGTSRPRSSRTCR